MSRSSSKRGGSVVCVPVTVGDWSAKVEIRCPGCGVAVKEGGSVNGLRYCYLCTPMMETSLTATHAACMERSAIKFIPSNDASRLATAMMQFAAFAVEHPHEAQTFLDAWRRK